ncbi:hypothetical protein ACJX0J_029201 [Zea mays]
MFSLFFGRFKNNNIFCLYYAISLCYIFQTYVHYIAVPSTGGYQNIVGFLGMHLLKLHTGLLSDCEALNVERLLPRLQRMRSDIISERFPFIFHKVLFELIDLYIKKQNYGILFFLNILLFTVNKALDISIDEQQWLMVVSENIQRNDTTYRRIKNKGSQGYLANNVMFRRSGFQSISSQKKS